MEILRGVIIKSIFIVPPAVLISAFYGYRKVALGILFGWLFGIVNLRSLSRNVQGLLGAEKAVARMIFLNLGRLLAMCTAIFLIIYYNVANVFALLGGFTSVFVLILFEGAKAGNSKRDNKCESTDH